MLFYFSFNFSLTACIYSKFYVVETFVVEIIQVFTNLKLYLYKK